ncbi:hypothetical protein BJ085DRAFT_38103 [Dimargaris cristalligena]|uniref:Carrier domain-containing protein n=1 Tax=Dimargaris cristalligena TaxID=215637 RepID=A0A4P9ZRE6_9FUNG|nr:hypothetical protein BJ085DRAFT_38103 [Dimargaris cristalligena]|eukprot:RKP35738.1 hypothetical protein BJ085DRAFT_38103 [Dimargaris cristalligena]
MFDLPPAVPIVTPSLTAVSTDYQSAIALPLSKPRISLAGYSSWVSILAFPGTLGAEHHSFVQTHRMATAIILSRYYRRPAVAFAHWRGQPSSPAVNGQVPEPFQLVLARVDPDSPISPAMLQNNAPIHIPESSGYVIEVILHTAINGSREMNPRSESGNSHSQSKEVEADPHIADLLAKSTAHLAIGCTNNQAEFTQITITYARAQYRDSAVAEFANQFVTVCAAVTQALKSDRPILIRDIAWVCNQERLRLLDFSHVNRPVQEVGQPIHHLFSDCARRYPDHLALIHGPDEWTYAQLDYASSELARVLVDRYGALPEVRIALLIPKSIAYNMVILAVFKSGAAYVPLDPDYPSDRIRFVLEDSGATLLITAEAVLGSVPDQLQIPTLTVDPYAQRPVTQVPLDFQSFPSSPSDLAYIIYTSGTTGRPKGVLVEHRGVANMATDPRLNDAYGPDRRTLQTGSIAFDGVLSITFRSLCSGSTLVISTDNLLEDLQNVNTGFLVTSFLSRLSPLDFPEMDVIVFGGESLLPEQQERWSPHCLLANHYGPTEGTVYSNMALIGPDDDITIGRPIRNVFNLVVDDDLQLVPVGVPGELLIGGVGVARGYQNLPELTAKKFIPNPFGEGRVYRTGDYVRWLPNGMIEFIGRIDNQIKLRGYRIEIDEIENVASQFSGLQQCVAVVVQDTLVLYASPISLDITGLLDYLRERLSKQMVPELVVPMADFKTTVMGKLDRQSLPAVGHLILKNSLSSITRSCIEAPHSEVEEDLRRVWGQVLQLDPDRISTTDHFFRIGGDSISAILLVSRGQQMGYQLTVPLIYQYPELRLLAQHIKIGTNNQANINSAYQEQILGEVALTPIQRWFSVTGLRNPHHFNQSFTLTVNPKATLSLAAISDAFVALANHHDILRARFQPDEGDQQWVQTIPTAAAVPADFLLLEETVSSEDYANFILRVQSSLNLTTGPVLAAVLIHNSECKSQSRLFITIHHILVDLIAWRILIEDLNTLFRGASLPPKTLPFQAWATQLGDYAATLSADIWPTQVDTDKPIADIVDLLPPPEWDTVGTQAARLSTSSEFDSDATQSLFELAPKLRVTPRDLLLATFTHAFATTIGLDQVTYCMESHGREPWSSDQDITRTVGWFTALYPLVLRVQLEQSLLDLLHHTKEAIQQIPMKGLPYALLKYTPGVAAEERAKLGAKTPAHLDVQFNYFGRFNGSNSDLMDDLLSIEWSDYFGLHDFAPHDRVIYDINPMPTVAGNCLRLIIEYNPLVYHRGVIDEFMAKWRHNLMQLANSINQPHSIDVEPLLTRFDFDHLRLSDTEFQEVISEVRRRQIPLDQVEDLLPCIALQGGLLTGLTSDATAYLVQAAFKIHGPLNADRLLKAWQAVSQQHTALRTIFIESSSKQSQGYIQAVLRSCSTAWTISEQPLKSLEEFLAHNRRRGFTLQEHMVRNFVFPTANSQVHQVIVTFHHSLCDGWSLPLLLQAWTEAYHHPNQPIPNPSASFTSVVHHVGQLHSDLTKPFWVEFLRDAPTTPAPLILLGSAGSPGWAEYLTSIDIPRADLMRCSQAHNVTVATLLRAAYALVLGRLLNQDDVVFGVTLSGRNLGLLGIDQTIGPCTNTLPFRVRLGHTSISSWLRTLHQDQVDMIPFEHSRLTDISRRTSLGRSGSLFQTLLGMENFPNFVTDLSHDFTLSDLRVHEFTEYPLAVNFIDAPCKIKVKVFYNTSNFSESAISLLIGMIQSVLRQISSVDTNTTVDQLALAVLPPNLQSVSELAANNTGDTLQPSSLVQIWDATIRDHSRHPAYVSKEYILSYGQVDQLADALAFRSSQILKQNRPSIVALVDSVEHLLVCLVSTVKLGAHLTLLASPCTLDQLTVCIELTASGAVWLPATKVEEIRPFLNGVVELVTISNVAEEHTNGAYVSHRFKPPTDVQDPSLSFISQKNSGDPVLYTASGSCIQSTLASTQHFVSDTTSIIFDYSVFLDTPQAAWLALLSLSSHGTIHALDLPLDKYNRLTSCRVTAADSLSNDLDESNRLVLCDLAQTRWSDRISLVKPTDSCLIFIESIFHGHQRVTEEQLASQSFPNVAKPSINYSLGVLDCHGHPCPPGIIGRLTFSPPLSSDFPIPERYPILGYRDCTNLVHVLGPVTQRVTVKDQQVHLGVLSQALVNAGALSPRCLILPDERIVALVANITEAELTRLEQSAAPPGTSPTLAPHAIISTHAFPHVTGLAEHLLPYFAQAYLATLPFRQSESMFETEWWLTVVVNELSASSTHSGDCSTAPLLRTSLAATLAQLELLQHRIQTKFGVNMPLGDLVKHAELRTLAPIIFEQVRQGPAKQSGDLYVKETNITSLPTSLLPCRVQPVSDRQRQIYSLSRLGDYTKQFYHQCVITFQAPLRLEVVQQAIEFLSFTFESLRTQFIPVQGVVACYVFSRVQVRVTETKLMTFQELSTDELFSEEVRLNLDQGILSQVDLYNFSTPNEEGVTSAVCLRVHDIVADSHLFSRMVNYLIMGLYGGSLDNADPFMAKVNSSQTFYKETATNYWKTLLYEPPTELILPLGHTRPLLSNFRSATVHSELDPKLVESLTNLESTEHISLQRRQSMSQPTPSVDFYSSLVNHLGLIRISGLARARVSIYPESHDKFGHNNSRVIFPGNSQSLFTYDLELVIRETVSTYLCGLRFNPEILESPTAERLICNFLHYVQACLYPERPWTNALIVSPNESRILLQEFALGGLTAEQMAVELPASVPRLFNHVVALYPNQTATEVCGQALTYLDLMGRIHLVATGLRRAQIQPEDKIGLIVTNHPDTVVGMLAIWFVGAIYVPIDCKLPAKRQKYVIETTNCSLVLNTTNMLSRLPNILALSDLLEDSANSGNWAEIYNNHPDDLAYIVFTSGTTGQPKGVMVTHGSLNYLISNPVFKDFREAKQRLMMGSSPGFDAFILISLITLCNGSTLVFYDDNLAETLRQVNQAWLVPSVINRLNPSDYPNLKKLCIMAEPLSRKLVDKWSAVPHIYNGYGPTETTIASHFTRISSTGPITIGRPIPYYECYILDSQLQLVPIGAVGEICIGGVGVCRGYINRPDLNPIKFIDNHFTGRGKLYRTGDLGRWLTNGHVECLGRMDSQVKLRGFRIELDEIRSVLMRQPRVQDCIVFVHDQFLVTYVFPESAANNDELHIALADSLPNYMIPSYFMGLPTVPLTVNGKCDTKFLQSHFIKHLATQRKQAPLSNLALDPSSQAVEALTQALIDVLGLTFDQINLQLSFVKLGGDSISAIQLSSKCRQLGFTLPTSAILRSRTLGSLVSDMEAANSTVDQTNLLRAIQYHTPFPITSTQQWFFDHPWGNLNHFNQSFALELTGPLSALQIESALLRLINYHAILRCQFTKDGPNSPNQWAQCILPPFAGLPIPVVEVIASLSDCPSQFTSLQSSLDISKGHHLAAGLITLSERNINSSTDLASHSTAPSQTAPRQLLFLTIHHLVVDSVSWSILLEDLTRLLDGHSPVPQHLSFATWATELAEWAKQVDPVPGHQLPPMPSSSSLPLISPDNLVFNTWGNLQRLSITLDKNHSDVLMAVDAFLIQPLELMLAGLFRALYSLTQASTITVVNKSHGRHSWDSSLDPSRTIGWFTALVPCLARASPDTTTVDFIKLAKQALRSSHGTEGLHHGLQKMVNCPGLTTSAGRPYAPIDVVLNYLEHTVDHATQAQQGRGPWSVCPELISNLAVCDSDELCTQLLEIIGLPTPNGLVFTANYCPQVIATGVIESLLANFHDSLISMIELFDKTPGPSLWTPADFPDLNATLPELAKLESELSSVGLSPLDVEDLYPMLPMQQGMWTATAKDPSGYMIQLAFTVTGVSDLDQLETATRALVADHAILRTTFLTTWSSPHCDGVQIITRAPRFDWHVLQQWSDVGADSEDAFLVANQIRGFTLDEPLLRVYVKQLSSNSFRYLLTIHHALIDGWSMGLIIKQLRVHLQNGNPSQAAATPLLRNYVSYCLQSYTPEAESFWRNYLQGVEQPTELELPQPVDKPELRHMSVIHFTLFSDYGRVLRIAKHLGCTPYTLVKAAWAILLSRYTGQTDVIFGNTATGRALPLAGIDSLVGCLINTVPFRVRFDSNMLVSELISSINTTSQQMVLFEHHHVAKINEWVDGEVRPSDMFNTLVVYENYPDIGLGDLNHTVTFTDTKSAGSTDYPFTVIAQVEHAEITACLSWDSSQIGQNYVESLAQHFCTLFNGLVCALTDSEKHTLVQDLSMLSADETALVTEQFACPTLAIDFEACVPDLFTRSVQIRPNTIAVEYEDTKWTYTYLYSQSRSLAQRLLDRGIPRETPIGLLIDRVPSTIAAFMGLQLSGAVLVPLDPTFPIERIQYIIEDCGINLVLTNMADQFKLDAICLALTQVEIQPIDSWLTPLQLPQDRLPVLPHIRSSDLSYIVYTSGTTGRPKGVQIEHRLMGNFVQQLESTVGITTGLRLMQNMAMTFDGALLEIFTGLCKGATLVLRTDLLDTLPKVNGLFATPTVLASLDPAQYPRLKTVISGGEALPREVAERWAHHSRVFNMYGPTEVLASHTFEYSLGDSMTIGFPVPNTKGYILDCFLRPVPIGVRGEIYVGGAQVTRGYVNLPELNKARLITNPFTGEGNIYRTGDSARWLPNGTVEYFSRHDDQVKIRGHRIEPQEIETVLLSHPDVQSAAVVIISRSVYAFVCPGSVSIGSVKSHISRILPAYMNPKALFSIDDLPRNTNDFSSDPGCGGPQPDFGYSL